jgi:hypothetical protein
MARRTRKRRATAGCQPALFAGAFRAVDLEAGRRARARFAAVVLADDFVAGAFFEDLDLGGLA